MSTEPGRQPHHPLSDLDLRPVARTAADVLAIIPHTLGYWPCHSIGILTAAEKSLGPCLRVELPSPENFSDPQWVAAWTTQLSEYLDYDPVGERLYVALYGRSYEKAAPGVDHAETDGRPAADARQGTETLDDDAGRRRLQEHALTVLGAIDEAGALSGHTLQDGWCVSGASWWAVTDPDRLHPVREILDSAVYVAMVCEGSVVARDPLEIRAGGLPLLPEQVAAPCMTPGAVGIEGYEWRLKYLEQWVRVLGTGQGRMPELTRDTRVLTELMLGTVDPFGCDLILAMALTGDAAASRTAWAERDRDEGGWREDAEEPAGILGPGLNHVAQVMSGRWAGTPDWERVDRCVVVLQDLIPMARGMQAADTDSARDVLPGDPYGEEGQTFLPSLLAGLWLALGHVERFRARGSLVERCADEAQRVAPWHPGVDRLRQLAVSQPVPVWAANPVTAWRR